MNLISFVKLLPIEANAQLVYNQAKEQLGIKNLAEHKDDTVTGVDYLDGCFVIIVNSAPTIPTPNGKFYFNACECKS